MGIFSGMLLASDIDGTLLSPDGKLPARNVEALRRFVDGGGHFAIATGRAHWFAKEIAARVPVNCPCIVFNGMLYDYAKQEMAYVRYLPESAADIIPELMERFPGPGFIVVCQDRYHEIRKREGHPKIPEQVNRWVVPGRLDELEPPWYKAVISANPEELTPVLEYLESRAYPGIRFVKSASGIVEVMDEQVSKGNALRQLAGMLGIERKNVVAVGDYYNDRDMIEYAGVGATLETSPSDLRDLAKMVVCSAWDGAIGNLVDQLERVQSRT